MRKAFFLAAFAASMTAVPASAAVTINAGGSNTVLNVGDSTTLSFIGISDGFTIDGLSNSLLLTLTAQSANQVEFGFTLTNTTLSPITSRISAFGFNVDPNASGASITNGVFDSVDFDLSGSSIANGREVEVCFMTHQNCTGGPGGVTTGSTSGTFRLTFSGDGNDITLSDFASRFQSIGGVTNSQGQAITSATGIINPIPEPGTWAMMLLGFGVVGYSLRRRRRASARPLLQAA